MFSRIESHAERKLVGQKLKMSFSSNKTKLLWQSFMPFRGEIRNKIGSDLFSVEVYTPNFFENYGPDSEFEKWAAVEVTKFEKIPDGMETLVCPAGLYAVFIHRGPASAGELTYRYIFESWLPNSNYSLDDRPHLAIMGPKYKHEEQDSEEEIWIPIKQIE
jgi:AraC family transcriptional regulator